MPHEESHLEFLRRQVVEQYAKVPTGCGGSFGEILCWEIHSNGMTFCWLAEKWGISLSLLGELIADHCRRLEPVLTVDHQFCGNRCHSREEIGMADRRRRVWSPEDDAIVRSHTVTDAAMRLRASRETVIRRREEIGLPPGVRRGLPRGPTFEREPTVPAAHLSTAVWVGMLHGLRTPPIDDEAARLIRWAETWLQIHRL